ncbi:MAG: Ig-like domain-containing protein [Thermoflexales bacterium]|nr:Ig-like domain-containing protein [Thermoflexales bacterium]
MKTRPYSFALVSTCAVLLIAALSLSGCDLFKPKPVSTPGSPTPTGASPTITPTSEPSALPTRPSAGYTPVPEGALSPVVVQRWPEAGQELAPEEGIQLVFDRAMDQAAVESAFAIQPAVEGKFEWQDSRTLSFKPDQPLSRGKLYDVVMKQNARAQDGASLRTAYAFRFVTAGYLEVGQVMPAPDSVDVETRPRITVIFNRPVVPLTALAQLHDLPQPLTLDPPASGHGEWLNTSIYVFEPDRELAGGTSYTAKVSGLQDADGNPLAEDYTWRFTTQPPQVVWVTPYDGQELVPVETVVRVEFNQAVDPGSAAQAFSLRADAKLIAGAFEVSGKTMIFTPTERLPFDAQIDMRLAAGISSPVGGEGMRGDYTWRFRTVPKLRILVTEPADGERSADPYTNFIIRFNAPVDPVTVMPNLSMTPPISPAQLYTYSWGTDFSLSFGARPSTDYTLHIGPDIADPYGNVTGQELTVRFRTRDLEPSLSLRAWEGVSTYNAYAPVRLYASCVNISRVDLKLYRVNPDVLRQRQNWYNYSPPSSSLIANWSQPVEAPLNKTSYALIDVGQQAALEPGLYVLTSDAPGLRDASWGRSHLLVVSRLNLTLKTAEREALVWVTDLQSGQPVPNVNVALYDYEGKQLGQASSGADGVARAKIEAGYNVAMALATEPFAAVSSDWSRGVSSWDFGLEASYGQPGYRAHLYTERPIYRPGQTVYFRGIVRAEDDVAYSLDWLNQDRPRQKEVHVIIDSPNGERVLEDELLMDDFGAFSGQLELAEGAALGAYSLQASLLADPQQGNFYTTFQVAAYRPPEFEVIVTPSQPQIARGTPVVASVQVKYFSGGPVASAPVDWLVLAEEYSFKPVWGGRYSFRDTDDPWRCFDCWWWRYQPPRQVVLSGSATTDGEGKFDIHISESDFQIPLTGSLRLVVEATATGADNQVISGRSEMVAHRGEYYAGLAAQKYLGKEGEPFGVDLVAVDWRGDNPRLPGKDLTVRIYRRDWKNTFVENQTGGGYWKSETSDTLVETQPVMTDGKGEAVVSFVPPQGGSYHIVVTDGAGESRPYGDVRSSLFVWVTGKEHVSWYRENNDRVTLIADKASYLPGETAEILIPSPFEGQHVALVTIERGHIIKHELVQMTSNSQVYRLPLTAEHAPNVYVSVVLIKGSGGGDGLADYKVGIVPLEVKPVAQSLAITLTPDPAQGQPGQEVAYTLRATDVNGQPVQAAFSLDLVDKAVLSLSPRPQNAIVDAFYGKRGLGVRMASGLAVSGNRAMEDLEQDLGAREKAAGGGVAVQATSVVGREAVPPAPMAADADGLMAYSVEEAAAVPAGVEIRQDFADTAYWNAEVLTDRDGQARVTLKLPDNLTTWVMRGVGATADTRVGEGQVELLSTKPLLIRPVAPRFFVVGDRAQLAAVINNNTDAALNATVALSATGLVLSTPAVQELTIPARGEVKVTWNVTVQDVEQVSLVFWTTAGDYSDASKPRLSTGPEGTLRVLRYTAPDIVGTAGDLAEPGARTEVVALPPKYDERQGELSVQLDPSLAAGMQDGLSYLEHYEYECAEQTVSRFLPNVLTYRALKELGISDPELEAKLPGLVQTGLDKLYSQQRGDGGWGWWRESRESNVHLTSYVVFALAKAQQAGFEVQADVLQRGQGFLAGRILSARELKSFAQANQQAFVLYALAEGGQVQKNQLGEMFSNRDKLSHYGRAFLAMGLWLGDPDDTRIATLLSDLNNAAILSATGAHWEEAHYDWWAMNTDTRSTAIILDALARLPSPSGGGAGGGGLAPNVVRWLMVARKGGHWETTQETAWALIALTDWMKATGELAGNYDYAVFLNDQDKASGQVSRDTIRQSIKLRVDVAELLAESNRLTIARGDGEGRLYYTAHLRVFLPVEEIEPAARGIVVERRYSLASCTDGVKCPEVNELRLGDIVRVDLTIIAPNDLYYVVVEDPLPAGGEAIDPGLATTGVLDKEPELRRQMDEVGIVEDVFTPLATSTRSYDWWWRYWYDRYELRDEKVVMFADYLSKGTYQFSYTFRATLPGDYKVIPTVAQEFYFPEVFGRSDGRLLSIGE